MKTRNSLVSNSSSTSFIAIMKEKDFDDIINTLELHSYTKKVIREQLININRFDGTNMIVFHYVSGNDSNISIDDLEESNEYDNAMLFDQIHDVEKEFEKLQKQEKSIVIRESF
jgi:hypothetical protein